MLHGHNLLRTVINGKGGREDRKAQLSSAVAQNASFTGNYAMPDLSHWRAPHWCDHPHDDVLSYRRRLTKPVGGESQMSMAAVLAPAWGARLSVSPQITRWHRYPTRMKLCTATNRARMHRTKPLHLQQHLMQARMVCRLQVSGL